MFCARVGCMRAFGCRPVGCRLAALRVIACFAGCLGLGFDSAAAAPASSASTVGTSYAGTLKAVDAGSPNDVWAVGDVVSARSTGTLVLHWNGTTWTRIPGPTGLPHSTTNTLTGVSVLSRSDVWAAGSVASGARGLLLHWNGRTLTEVAGPNHLQGMPLYAISGISRNDIWAAAPNSLLHWNGRRWSVAYSHRFRCGGGLLGIWFASRSDGWAVGSHCVQQDSGTETVILHWNGRNWARAASPNPGGFSAYPQLASVSGSSRSDLWAVGNSTSGSGTLALHWNGTSWRKVFTPPSEGAHQGDTLNGVSSLSPSDAWAVGYYAHASAFAEKTLALRWDGSRWAREPSPNHDGPKGTALNAVVAVSPNDAWAVGNYGANGGVPRTWIIHWNGKAWTG